MPTVGLRGGSGHLVPRTRSRRKARKSLGSSLGFLLCNVNGGEPAQAEIYRQRESSRCVLNIMTLRNRNMLMVAAAAMLSMQSAEAFFVRVAGPPPSSMMLSMRVSGIESTPNPSSFKFNLDETLHRCDPISNMCGARFRRVACGQGADEDSSASCVVLPSNVILWQC